MKPTTIYKVKSVTILLIFLIILLSGCASTVKVPMQIPPKDTSATKLRRVAVLPFAGNFGDEVVPYLQNTIAKIEIDGKPYFTVVERVHINKVFI